MSVVVGMPEHEYHARPELSSTEARLLLETPATYRWAKDHPPLVAPSKKFDLGTAVHSLVLGAGAPVAIIPEDVLASNGYASTAAAKQFIAEARANGLVPLKQADYEPIVAQAEAVLGHSSARAFLTQSGDPEVSVFATDPVSGVDVRARFDFLPEQGDQRRVAVDLKTTRDASKRAFEKAVASYEYGIQRAWYLDTLNLAVGPMPVGLEPEMVFVAVQKEPPYLVGVYQLPTVWAEKGHVAAREARRLFAECSESGVWPGLPGGVQLLDEPVWHVFEHEERFGNE